MNLAKQLLNQFTLSVYSTSITPKVPILVEHSTQLWYNPQLALFLAPAFRNCLLQLVHTAHNAPHFILWNSLSLVLSPPSALIFESEGSKASE